QILFLEKLAETTDITTDRHGHDGPSWDGPSQLRRTIVRPHFKTLQLLRIWYRERFSERRDGSAGRTVTSSLVKNGVPIVATTCMTDRRRHDGPSQVAQIPGWVGFLYTF
ncbi:hypothetical protein EJD97_004786, partial [Solanum chilense]